MTPDQKFLKLGTELPPPPKIPNNFSFVGWKIIGDNLYLSGIGPIWGKNFSVYPGKIPTVISIEDGIKAARLCGLNLLQSVRQALDSLDNIEEIITINGIVNAEQNFTDHSLIINGCSNLLVDIFGEKGKHTRTAIGANSLPFDFCVEIQMHCKVKLNTKNG